MKAVWRWHISFIYLFVLILLNHPAHAQSGGVVYPYPVHQFTIHTPDSTISMAYMDVSPAAAAAKRPAAILLLHGKNFNGYYWKDIIPSLANQGYRVIVPDQVGWGRSSKPVTSYSFHWLAANTAALLDSLHIQQVIVIGHSMGGMLATRFAIQFPQKTTQLILENPIGLEDYKRFVPMQPLEKLIAKENKATYESYKQYQQSYYPEWKPEYEQYVQAQAEALSDPQFPTIAKVNALTYQMIYEQPVCYEWDRISMPVLLIIGQSDRTVVGKDLLTDQQKKVYGQYPALGKQTKQKIKNAKLVELPGVGHIPHVQVINFFLQKVFQFIE
jgi:pimeloyl-ACP methyl ester carboxylesterase